MSSLTKTSPPTPSPSFRSLAQSWACLALCFAAKQQQTHGHISDSMIASLIVVLAYISKFFMWETGYWSSMDIMHDRAGYYICWGCLVSIFSLCIIGATRTHGDL